VVNACSTKFVTADAHRSKDFYCRVLGFQVLERPPFKSHGYWIGTAGIFPDPHHPVGHGCRQDRARRSAPSVVTHVLRGGRI